MNGLLTFQISREICSSMKAVHSHTSTKDVPYVWTRNASKLHLVNVFRLFERAFRRIRSQHHFTNVSKSNIQSIRKICRCNFWSLLSTKSDSGFHEPLNTLIMKRENLGAQQQLSADPRGLWIPLIWRRSRRRIWVEPETRVGSLQRVDRYHPWTHRAATRVTHASGVQSVLC